MICAILSVFGVNRSGGARLQTEPRQSSIDNQLHGEARGMAFIDVGEVEGIEEGIDALKYGKPLEAIFYGLIAVAFELKRIDEAIGNLVPDPE
jgi:hypothetical protein